MLAPRQLPTATRPLSYNGLSVGPNNVYVVVFEQLLKRFDTSVAGVTCFLRRDRNKPKEVDVPAPYGAPLQSRTVRVRSSNKQMIGSGAIRPGAAYVKRLPEAEPVVRIRMKVCCHGESFNMYRIFLRCQDQKLKTKVLFLGGLPRTYAEIHPRMSVSGGRDSEHTKARQRFCYWPLGPHELLPTTALPKRCDVKLKGRVHILARQSAPTQCYLAR